MENLQIMALILGSLLAFVLFWSGVVWFIARLSGWSSLAEVYPARIPFNETCWSRQSARFRWNSNYSGILRVCADSQALHLSVLALFRPGNAPLSIPWEDISATAYGVGVELRFYRAKNVPLRISRRLAEQIVQAADGRFQIVAQ
jgi:hypothetical protein